MTASSEGLDDALGAAFADALGWVGGEDPSTQQSSLPRRAAPPAPGEAFDAGDLPAFDLDGPLPAEDPLFASETAVHPDDPLFGGDAPPPPLFERAQSGPVAASEPERKIETSSPPDQAPPPPPMFDPGPAPAAPQMFDREPIAPPPAFDAKPPAFDAPPPAFDEAPPAAPAPPAPPPVASVPTAPAAAAASVKTPASVGEVIDLLIEDYTEAIAVALVTIATGKVIVGRSKYPALAPESLGGTASMLAQSMANAVQPLGGVDMFGPGLGTVVDTEAATLQMVFVDAEHVVIALADPPTDLAARGVAHDRVIEAVEQLRRLAS